jgi:hypothetical protein
MAKIVFAVETLIVAGLSRNNSGQQQEPGGTANVHEAILTVIRARPDAALISRAVTGFDKLG